MAATPQALTDTPQPGLFRLAGFGGAAWYAHGSPVAGDLPRLRVDVDLLSPDEVISRRDVLVARSYPGQLAGFFAACARDLRPELTVAPAREPLSGLLVSVMASTE